MTTLTASELEQGRRYLEQTRTGVIGAAKGLTEAQWRFKPAPDRWSIAENIEHVLIVNERVLGPVREQLANAPSAGNPDREAVDAIVLYRFQDRTLRFKGPDAIHPTRRSAPSELLERLNETYDRLIECLESTPDLRDHAIPSPPLKAVSGGAHEMMDGYQWILAAGAHVDRHSRQILEVKADPNFPV